MNTTALLLAIAMVESGNNPLAVGPKGEISQYQFIPKVWKTYTDIPFKSILPVNQQSYADVIALRHLRWLTDNSPRYVANNPRCVAAMWHIGKTGFKLHKYQVSNLNPTQQLYVTRVYNLYLKYCSSTPK